MNMVFTAASPFTMPCSHALERLVCLQTAKWARRLAWPAWEYVTLTQDKTALLWSNTYGASLSVADILAVDWVVE